MWRNSMVATLAVAVSLAVAPTCLGQNILSGIVGHVTDSSGAVVPGAAVTVTNQGTGISVRTVTDFSGSYSVPNLFAGTYSVTVSAKGFATYKVTGIVVQASSIVRQDATLRVGATHQVVTVAGAAPLIHTDSARSLASNVSLSLLCTAPGFQY